MGTLETGVYELLPLVPELVDDEGLHLFRRRPEEHFLEVDTLSAYDEEVLVDAESAAVGLVDVDSDAAAGKLADAESAAAGTEDAPAPARFRFRKLPTISAIFP